MTARDPRYGSTKWRKTSILVRQRAGERCQMAPDCPRRATVADHIVPVHPGMPDHEFFSFSNLRAGCHFHNTRRGMAERWQRETAGAPDKPARTFMGRSGSPYGRTRIY